jgi:hypothetical protein
MATDQDTGSAFDAAMARIAVGAYDDAQQQRQAMLNRIRDVVRKRNEDIPFDAVEDEKDDDERDYGSKYEDDNLPGLIEEMREEGKLTPHEEEYLRKMLSAAQTAEQIEQQYNDAMGIVEREPIYTEWLQHVNGIGTTLTARLINQFGYAEDFEKVSNMWSYSGLAPGQERRRGEQAGFSPDAKRLAWLCADRIIMQGSRSTYKEAFYDPYKQKQVHRKERADEDLCAVCGAQPPRRVLYQPQGEDEDFGGGGPDVCEECYDEDGGNPSAPNSQGHADTRARRYLGKKVLKHYWAIARDIKGLEVPDEWVITHGGHDKREDTWENPFHAKRELMDG